MWIMVVDYRGLSKWHVYLLPTLLFGLNEWVVCSSRWIPIHGALWLWWAWCICLPPASVLLQFTVQELFSTEEITLHSSRFTLHSLRFTQHGTGIRVNHGDSKLMAGGETIEKSGFLDERKMHQVESLYKQKKWLSSPCLLHQILLPSKW